MSSYRSTKELSSIGELISQMESDEHTPLVRQAPATHNIQQAHAVRSEKAKRNTVESLYEEQDQDSPEENDGSYDNWEFAGWGTVTKLDYKKKHDNSNFSDLSTREDDTGTLEHAKAKAAQHHKLGVFRATSIAGNDITSSCLYVAGIGAQSARKFTPISLLIVVIVLWFFRSIYSEVGEALPLNGGSYNVLLNSTTKLVAAFAACLSIISYVATAVVSAVSAVSYIGDLYAPLGEPWMVVVVLGVFAVLNIIGIGESANVAFGIFVMHITTLVLLVIVAAIRLFEDPSLLKQNWEEPMDLDPASAIYFGYAAALLGVTGFETSSNYIEEQKEGVFPKTLFNMWVLVALFNPLLSLLSLGTLPMKEILENESSLLAWMAFKVGGTWLNYIVCIDAFLVLSGAVLTAYVGVTGLVKRMSLDRCMPEFLMHENSLRHTNHWIILIFFAITTSLYFIVDGNINMLGGVYTIAFLGVMSLFAIGNMLMKYKRGSLRRKTRASWPAVLFGLFAIWAGLIGNVAYNLDYLLYFALYFAVTMTIVLLMFARTRLLKMVLYFISKTTIGKLYFSNWITKQIKQINAHPLVFFAKTEELHILGKAVQYVRDNEQSSWMKIVHVYSDESKVPPNMELHIHMLDKMYPKMRLDLVLVKGEFGPALVNRLAEELDVPRNYMFITCPGGNFPHNLADFGGIRLITH